jgi:hypothetical protein
MGRSSWCGFDWMPSLRQLTTWRDVCPMPNGSELAALCSNAIAAVSSSAALDCASFSRRAWERARTTLSLTMGRAESRG